MAQAPGRKVHITPEGAKKLQAELEQLWRVERPRVTRKVTAAATLGDRFENAEYIYGKKRLREIDRRIEFLRKRYALLQVVQPAQRPDRRPDRCLRRALLHRRGTIQNTPLPELRGQNRSYPS